MERGVAVSEQEECSVPYTTLNTSDSSELAVITLFCCPLAEEVCLEVAVMFVVMLPGGYVGSRCGG